MTIEAEALRVLAPAKINLFLHVGDKRSDGFHALQSLVVFARMGDELALSPDRDIKVVASGRFAAGLPPAGQNLVHKAARALAQHAGITRGAYISLKKNLPVSSGIGGGSADAAAALRGLARLWNLKVEHDVLRQIGETLGSDVPVCVACRPQWMEGRGETLAQVESVPAVQIVLVNPRVGVATKDVFAALKDRRGTGQPRPPAMRTTGDLVAFLKDTTNDLEAPARAVAPVISDVLREIAAQPGVLLTRMSGSGATCFGLFGDPDDAARAALTIGEGHPSWWVSATATTPVLSAALA
ncbi:MAG: 4-(cytidine 5'-diphospho)-2-C-methyl-D-erythritol kinase [Alphaproteobacteria bacterium]|nr:4-(cytidine 5'-diphospho)-2-C-methyl-D-erythritol kinase [Alphaproteobacteria bacterium]